MNTSHTDPARACTTSIAVACRSCGSSNVQEIATVTTFRPVHLGRTQDDGLEIVDYPTDWDFYDDSHEHLRFECADCGAQVS